MGRALLCLKAKSCGHVSYVTCSIHFLFADQPHQTHTSNVPAVPAWKRELAEKRKQRVVNGVQASNKENEPKTSPAVPQWKKEFAERRKRREMSPTRMQPDKREQSPETPEWQQRLANMRRTQPIVGPRGPVKDSTDQVPSFMKEFEGKKKPLPRGTCSKLCYLFSQSGSRANKTHCFPGGQSLSVLLYLPTQK